MFKNADVVLIRVHDACLKNSCWNSVTSSPLFKVEHSWLVVALNQRVFKNAIWFGSFGYT
jgi:hypothetical protein